MIPLACSQSLAVDGPAELERVPSEQLGAIEVPREKIFRLPRGLLGFPQARRFCLVEVSKSSRFLLLQSCDRADLAFVVIDPLRVDPEFDLAELTRLASGLIEPDEEVFASCTVSLRPPPAPPTTNLLAPLLIGVRSRVGAQIVLPGPVERVRFEI